MLKHKKEPTRNGSSEVGKGSKSTDILTHASAHVNTDAETWSDELNYWRRRCEDEVSDIG